MKDYKKGFTLAEVLITLAIIGVVAAMTIPALIQSTNKLELVTGLQKQYSTFSQVYNLLLAENGGDVTSVITGTTETDSANFMDTLSTKLKVAKNCKTAMGCWYTTPLKWLNGTQRYANLDLTWDTKYGKTILSDGSIIRVDISNASCLDTAGTSTLKICGNLVIDINGAKGPNTIGKDNFAFWITKTGIYPFGTDNDGQSCNAATAADSTNWGCTAKVLTEGAMNY